MKLQTTIRETWEMAESSSGDKPFDALNTLVNVLVEHEKNLDHLIKGLSTVIGQLNKNEKINGQMDHIFDKITDTQKEITTFVNNLQDDPPENGTPIPTKNTTFETTTACALQESHKITLHCVQWKDFQNLALQAQTVSFSFKEGEKTFHVYALKNSQIITFAGLIPQISLISKAWLAKQINVSEKLVFEGSLNLPTS